MSVHRGVPVALPLSSTATIEKQLTLTVSLQADGTLFLDKEPVTLENLGETLKRRAAENKQTGVLLFADKNLPYQKLYTVLDLIRRVGLSQVSLQAEVR
jgi:biopolymer transport protein ExbD